MRKLTKEDMYFHEARNTALKDMVKDMKAFLERERASLNEKAIEHLELVIDNLEAIVAGYHRYRANAP